MCEYYYYYYYYYYYNSSHPPAAATAAAHSFKSTVQNIFCVLTLQVYRLTTTHKTVLNIMCWLCISFIIY